MFSAEMREKGMGGGARDEVWETMKREDEVLEYEVNNRTKFFDSFEIKLVNLLLYKNIDNANSGRRNKFTSTIEEYAAELDDSERIKIHTAYIGLLKLLFPDENSYLDSVASLLMSKNMMMGAGSSQSDDGSEINPQKGFLAEDFDLKTLIKALIADTDDWNSSLQQPSKDGFSRKEQAAIRGLLFAYIHMKDDIKYYMDDYYANIANHILKRLRKYRENPFLIDLLDKLGPGKAPIVDAISSRDVD